MENQSVFEDISNFFPDWWDEAACQASDISIFFGSGAKPSNVTKARNMCKTCPALKDCFTHAMSHPEDYGVWAGTSVLDRNSIRDRIAGGDEIDDVLRLHIRAELKWSDHE